MSRMILRLRSNRFSKELLVMLVGFALLRFLLAFLFPVFGDACRYFIMAKAIYAKPSLFAMRGLSYPTPLFLLVSALFYGLFIPFGERTADLSLRLVSPLFGSLTLVFTYLAAKRMFNEKTALLSVVFLGLSPSHIMFSSIGYMEGLFVFLVSLSLYFLVRDNSKPRETSYILCGIALGLASLTRQTGLLVAAIMALFILFDNRIRSRTGRLKSVFLMILGLSVIAGPWYIDQLYRFGTIDLFGQIFPAHEPATITLDTLLYRVDIYAPRSSIGTNEPTTYYQPWFRLIGTYYEFWGVWGGAFDVLLRVRIPFFDPSLLLLGFTVVTLFLSLLHVLGVFKSIRNNRAGILHLLAISTFSVFLFVIFAQWIEYGSVSPSLGYRKPLITIAPVLAIYGGEGWKRLLEIAEETKHRHASKLLIMTVSVCLVLCLAGLCFEGNFMRERYQERLLSAAQWIKHNTLKDAVVLTSRDLEIAYLTGRRTMAMYLVQASAIDQDLLIRHNVSYIFIPSDELTQDARLGPYVQRFSILKNMGFLEEAYRDSFGVILKAKKTA